MFCPKYYCNNNNVVVVVIIIIIIIIVADSLRKGSGPAGPLHAWYESEAEDTTGSHKWTNLLLSETNAF